SSPEAMPMRRCRWRREWPGYGASTATLSKKHAGLVTRSARRGHAILNRRRATTALRLAVEADPAFELALADLDAMTGTSGQRHSRGQMNWERHHIEVVRTAASGNGKRAADLLREHLAGVGCDPLAFRIVAQMRQPAGTDDGFENLAGQLPDCHPTRWPSSPSPP